MFQVYVLQSQKTNRLYIGSTSDVQKRLVAHNAGDVQSTRPYRPYRIILIEEYDTVTAARHRENQIKRSGRLRKELKQFVALSSSGLKAGSGSAGNG